MLSTSTGWPSRSVSLLPSRRATVSGLPPAAVGMMIFSGRDGQLALCASADETSGAAMMPCNSVLRVSDILATPPRPAASRLLAPSRIVAHRVAIVQSGAAMAYALLMHALAGGSDNML